ncbi:MAG: hydroxyacylglutathione hydrolase, partial [Oceanospirillaceae bacterium]
MALLFEIIPVTQFQQNCSLVWCDETMEAALVDPGGELPRLLDRVSVHGVELKQILLTHAHIDHAG